MQVSDEMIKVLEYLCEKIGVTIDWTSGNVLPYVEQLCAKFIHWEIATSIAWLVIGVIFAFVGCLFIRPAKKKWAEFNDDGYDSDFGICVIYWCIFGILALIALFVIPTQVFDIIECCTFPEKTLFDYIQLHIGSVN